MECVKNRPGPSDATMKYTTCTYPLVVSAKMNGAGRSHPVRPRSVESAISGACQLCPRSTDRATTSKALLSARGAHHAAYAVSPRAVVATSEPAHCGVPLGAEGGV